MQGNLVKEWVPKKERGQEQQFCCCCRKERRNLARVYAFAYPMIQSCWCEAAPKLSAFPKWNEKIEGKPFHKTRRVLGKCVFSSQAVRIIMNLQLQRLDGSFVLMPAIAFHLGCICKEMWRRAANQKRWGSERAVPITVCQSRKIDWVFDRWVALAIKSHFRTKVMAL